MKVADVADLKKSGLAGIGSLTGVAASTVSSGVASVTVGGITVSAYVVRGVTLAVGDPVLIVRQGSVWWVLGALFTAAPTVGEEADATPPPKPAVTTGSLVCAPVETRSYRDGRWRTDTDDVLQGVYGGYGNNTGCVFYGNTPRSLSGATVTAARLRVKRLRGGVFASQTSTLRLMTERVRPSGAPSLTSSTSGPALAVDSSTSSFAVPASWAQELVDGTSGGLAVYIGGGSPYMRFAGRGSWSPAFTLTIDWTR